MATRRSKKDQAITTQSPVVRALLILATMEDFNRSWRSIEDISCIIQSIFDLPRTKKNQLSGPVIVMNLSNDALTKESVDLRVNDIGIFRDEFQRKTSDGKKRRMKCLYLCPPKELPPTPEHGTKWYTNLQDLPLDWESKRLRMQKDDNYKIVQEDLSKLVRQLAKPATTKTAAQKQTLKRVKEDETQEEPFSKGLCAKKPKVADLSSSLKDLDNKAIADSRLSKLIARISEGDEHTKFQLTKEEIVSLMNFVTARCIAKLARLAAAEEEEVISLDDGKEDNDNNIRHEDCENTDVPNEPNEMIETNETNETNEMNEANNTNEGQNEEQYRYMNSSVSIANQELELPNSHTVISRSYFSRLVESDKLSRKLRAKIIKAKQYRSSPLGQRFYNAALIQAPRMSLYAAEQVLPLVVAAFLADAGIAIDPEAVAKSCPSAKTLNSFIVDGSIDSILWLEDQFRDADAICISCDKGNRKGIDHFPKAISWWSKKERKVLSACIDADGSGGKSEECAAAIGHSVKKFRNAIQFFFGQTTDSGGGGVLYSLERELSKLNLCSPIYFVAPCTLHGMNLIFANSVKAVFGEGGLDYRNVMQLLHSLYDLVGRYEHHELLLMWESVNGQAPPNKISKAVLTRWWWVNVAAQHLKDNWDQWQALAQAALNNTTANTAAGKIASSILSLMSEEKIGCDLHFMVAFSKSYFVKHMTWLQCIDQRSGDFGYLSRHMPVRTYIIMRDLEKLVSSWEDDPCFAEFKALASTFTGNETTTPDEDEMRDNGAFRAGSKSFTYEGIKREVNLFFEDALSTARKHFTTIWTGPLIHFAIAGEKDTSVPFCKWLCDGTTQGLGTIASEVHQTTIDLDNMIEFFSGLKTREAVKAQGEVETFGGPIAAIAGGEDIWQSELTIELRRYVEAKILPLASSTHRVEAMVRECSHCASTDRGESTRSHYILQRSVLNSKINEISAKDREGRVLHANASTGSGLQGERELRSEDSIRKHGGAMDDKNKVRQRTRGALRVVAAVGVVMERYTNISRKSTADRKAVKALLNNKMATVRIGAKVESFESTVLHPRQPNKRERERGVDKTYRVTDRIPFKRAKAIHILHIIEELQARPTIIFSLDINHTNAVTKLKDFEGSQKCFKPLTPFFRQMLQDEMVNP
jgi:hypothetical protein